MFDPELSGQRIALASKGCRAYRIQTRAARICTTKLVPANQSTALIAGHVNGPGGRAGIFADLHKLVRGDPVIVHDARDGREVHFTVTDAEKVSLEDASDPEVLKRIYGTGPVNGNRPEPSADGLAHLILITCTGTFKNGTHDHRLVVSAVRTS